MFFQALVLSAALELGFVSGGYYNYTQHTLWQKIGALYTDMDLTVKYGALYLGGEMNCYFVPIAIDNYNPFQMTFVFKGGLEFHNFSLNIERSCFHPVNIYYTIKGSEIMPKYEGGMWKAYIKIKTEE